jgi:hypothetical protein
MSPIPSSNRMCTSAQSPFHLGFLRVVHRYPVLGVEIAPLSIDEQVEAALDLATPYKSNSINQATPYKSNSINHKIITSHMISREIREHVAVGLEPATSGHVYTSHNHCTPKSLMTKG